MIKRQKFSLVTTLAVIGLMIIFPPYVVKGIKDMVIKAGYSFILDLPTYTKDTIKYDANIGDIVQYTMNIPATVNVSMLAVQIFAALIIGGLFYYILRD